MCSSAKRKEQTCESAVVESELVVGLGRTVASDKIGEYGSPVDCKKVGM